MFQLDFRESHNIITVVVNLQKKNIPAYKWREKYWIELYL